MTLETTCTQRPHFWRTLDLSWGSSFHDPCKPCTDWCHATDCDTVYWQRRSIRADKGNPRHRVPLVPSCPFVSHVRCTGARVRAPNAKKRKGSAEIDFDETLSCSLWPYIIFPFSLPFFYFPSESCRSQAPKGDRRMSGKQDSLPLIFLGFTELCCKPKRTFFEKKWKSFLNVVKSSLHAPVRPGSVGLTERHLQCSLLECFHEYKCLPWQSWGNLLDLLWPVWEPVVWSWLWTSTSVNLRT